ncbi:MAG: ATP synthase F1 subunit delta [Planctomycetales bacterium]|nr:ATP synthase F1 subunit delta [Planctomycetales bacterium]
MTQHDQKTVLDIDAEQVAAVYAKAIFGAAEGAGKLDDIGAELTAVAQEAFVANPQFAELLGGGQLSHDERVGVIDRVFGSRVSDLLLSFLKVLSAHGRLGCLVATSRRYREMLDERNGVVQVTVRAAGPIDDALRDEIAGKLGEVLKIKPVVHVVNDPSLLGGLVVRVGDTVFDGSVATRLAQMRTRMIDRTVEEIETRREAFLT